MGKSLFGSCPVSTSLSLSNRRRRRNADKRDLPTTCRLSFFKRRRWRRSPSKALQTRAFQKQSPSTENRPFKFQLLSPLSSESSKDLEILEMSPSKNFPALEPLFAKVKSPLLLLHFSQTRMSHNKQTTRRERTG